eukprot:CAMPEP_0115533386 /NCGR_PEP_ID=MMETSP0271-20121206/86094_1 /TAXON_ID=71861 /ORGANISM="Scrippsiella trochoidea, Strain CCMP3099" /LENGTH=50 /DNA_ID=CAMNT_0002965765 /DNA_START=131 /DNA_END=283 /DNA_ORIENTATION=-
MPIFGAKLSFSPSRVSLKPGIPECAAKLLATSAGHNACENMKSQAATQGT